MSNKKISALSGLDAIAAADEFAVVDKSDLTDGADGTSKKVTRTVVLGDLASITASSTEINTLDGITASTAELNILDGVTATAAELNIMDGVTASAAELNALDGITATVTELNYTDGVTSAIQTQIDTKVAKVSPVITSGDLQLPDNGNIIDTAATDSWKTISVSAGYMKPTTTSGCATSTKIEAGTNDIDYDVLDFDTATDENAYFNIFMPGNWDAGVIQFRYVWTNAAGLTTETVTFELSGISYADSDAIDVAVGTPIEVADTWLAQGDVHISAWSGDVTIAGTPAPGEWVHFEIMRDVSEDNLTGDARLIVVQIRYKESQYNHY